MNNEVGFMTGSIIEAMSGYQFLVMENLWNWDRQTIVIMSSKEILNEMSKHFTRNRRQSSHYECDRYTIDGFVNMNYHPSETDPANRNVRIVYCNEEVMEYSEIIDRFQNSYIIRVRRGEEIDGIQRLDRTVPEISG